MNRIQAYWWKARNFGDLLTPILLSKLTGKQVRHSSDTEESPRIVGCGSIAQHVNPGDHVWGTGHHKPWRRLNWNGVQAHCVRGPRTRALISGCEVPELYADPAMLMPVVYQPARKIEKRYAVGIVPHYIEFRSVAHPSAGETGIEINLQDPPHIVIDQMMQCERIVTSSLHGVIVAEAYGLPVEWHVWSNRIIGGEFKFLDYFEGTGRSGVRAGELVPRLGQDVLAGAQAMLQRTLKNILASGGVIR